MSIPRFTARALTGSVRIVGDARENFLTGNFFERGGLHPTDIIDFGKMQIKARVSSYQVPGGPAVVVNKTAGDAKTVRAPKIREKIVIDENFAAVLNAALDSYRGPMGTAPNDQLPEKIALEQRKLRMRIERAVELQAIQGLTTGTITLIDENGSTIGTIDLEFSTAVAETDYDKNILLARTGTNLWSAGNSKPADLLERMAGSIRDNSDYSGPLGVIMGLDAYLAFEANEKIQKEFDNRQINVGTLSPTVAATRRGRYRNLEIYQYSNGYVNNSGTRVAAVDPKKIIMLPDIGSNSGKLTIEYGAIWERMAPNEQARFHQTDYFSKLITDSEDPPADELIVESRPLALIKDASAVRVCQVVA